jgi:VanZ family protein
MNLKGKTLNALGFICLTPFALTVVVITFFPYKHHIESDLLMTGVTSVIAAIGVFLLLAGMRKQREEKNLPRKK